MSEGFAALFQEASEQQKLRLLAELSYELTMHGRAAYAAGADEFADPLRMRLANEANHRIQSYLRAYLADRSDRIPDEAFALVLQESLERLGIAEGRLVETLDRLSGG